MEIASLVFSFLAIDLLVAFVFVVIGSQNPHELLLYPWTFYPRIRYIGLWPYALLFGCVGTAVAGIILGKRAAKRMETNQTITKVSVVAGEVTIVVLFIFTWLVMVGAAQR